MRRLTARPRTVVSGPGTAIIVSLLVSVYLTRAVHADTYAFGAGYFGEHSDNIRRTPANTEAEWINSLIAGVAYQKTGSVLDANLLAQVEYRDYWRDTYEDGPLYFADASLLWRIAPERLHWFLTDRFSQITRDVTLPDTPDNRINANVLSTGPDAYIRFGQINTLVLGLRYGNTTDSDGVLDNDRYGGFARWQYAASKEVTYSLNYEYMQVRYANEVTDENLQRQDAFVRMDRRKGLSSIQLDLGATMLNRESTGDTTGLLARLTSIQQLTTISSTGLLLASEYLDAGAVLLSTTTSSVSESGIPTTTISPGGVTNDFFYTRRFAGYYKRNDDIYGLDARAFYRDLDYEVSPQDRREAGGRLEGSYNLFNALETSLYGSLVYSRYLSNPREDYENEVGIRFLYRMNSYLGAVLEGRSTWRYSTDASAEYTDNRIMISLTYSSGPSYVPRAERTGGQTRPSFLPL